MNIWATRMLSVLRVMAALLFMEHGLMKLFHFPGPQPGVSDPLSPMFFVAALIELIGGTLLTLGLFTRAAAFICAGEMAVGYFVSHAPLSFWPAINGGDPAILLCFTFLYLFLAGGGEWSLDTLRMGKPYGPQLGRSE